MPSKRKLSPVVTRDGINGTSAREQELSTVEVDTVFGRLLGLLDGQKVCASFFLFSLFYGPDSLTKS